MTPDQEIQRYKKIFADDWERLSTMPEFQIALETKDPTRLAEIAQREICGEVGTESEMRKKGLAIA